MSRFSSVISNRIIQYFNIVLAFKYYCKSPNGSDFESQLPFCFISLKNFLENTFVPQSESDTGLFMRIDKKIAKSLFPIIHHLIASFSIGKVCGHN